MTQAFADLGVGTRVAGNRVMDKVWQMPEGWDPRKDIMNTETRDASGKGSYNTALVLLEPNGLDLKPTKCQFHSYVQMFKRTEELVDVLKTESVDGIRGIMSLGEKMAKGHLQRFQSFEKMPPKQACLALAGEPLGAEDWSEDTRKYAEKHLRMLSGLYGVLRPYDDVKPVRDMPMSAKIKTKKGIHLTDFWGDSITRQLNKDLKAISEGNKGGHCLLVRCTSASYFSVVQVHNLNEGVQLVEIEFEQCPDDVAAKARCQFARWAIENKVNTPEALKDFKSQEWSLDERRCTLAKVFYVWIGDDKKAKKSKKEGKEKEKDKKSGKGKDVSEGSEGSGAKRSKKKKKDDRDAPQDFSDVDSGEFTRTKPKREAKKVKKVAQDFSDVESDEYVTKPKKRKQAAPQDFSDVESGSNAGGRRRKVRRVDDDEDSEAPRGRKPGRAKEERRRRRDDSR
eukprot:TRINITY_DN1559_c0_g3_i1.p1 TRINITY_DN1559_c0_g3~~TRINITY_DN1559_c0_g3_i1.p1  ORF type:complete len:477 (+),score=106.06 TRINITY_DN1559_c0_g3_i1:75-1433(+)